MENDTVFNKTTYMDCTTLNVKRRGVREGGGGGE
jgi:hypothetical protein